MDNLKKDLIAFVKYYKNNVPIVVCTVNTKRRFF